MSNPDGPIERPTTLVEFMLEPAAGDRKKWAGAFHRPAHQWHPLDKTGSPSIFRPWRPPELSPESGLRGNAFLDLAQYLGEQRDIYRQGTISEKAWHP